MSVTDESATVECDAAGCAARQSSGGSSAALRARLRSEDGWRWKRNGRVSEDFCPAHAALAVELPARGPFQPALF